MSERRYRAIIPVDCFQYRLLSEVLTFTSTTAHLFRTASTSAVVKSSTPTIHQVILALMCRLARYERKDVLRESTNEN